MTPANTGVLGNACLPMHDPTCPPMHDPTCQLSCSLPTRPLAHPPAQLPTDLPPTSPASLAGPAYPPMLQPKHLGLALPTVVSGARCWHDAFDQESFAIKGFPELPPGSYHAGPQQAPDPPTTHMARPWPGEVWLVTALALSKNNMCWLICWK